MTETAADDSDGGVLKEKMQDALATLKRAPAARRRALRSAVVSDHRPAGRRQDDGAGQFRPQFPLAGDSAARAVRASAARVIAIGGSPTRRCSSTPPGATRPRIPTPRPIARVGCPSSTCSGTTARISRSMASSSRSVSRTCSLVAGGGHAHADAIRKRLNELHEELKVDFPVYAMFTKMDLIVGFNHYFADLDEERRRQSGARHSRPPDRRANSIGDAPAEIDLLIERIATRMPDRLQYEPDLRARALMFGLPAQLAALRKPVARLPQPHLRADALSVDGDVARLLFHLRHAGRHAVRLGRRRAAAQLRRREFERGGLFGRGKSFFLHDLLAKVIFGEAGWVSTNVAAVRRAFAFRTAMFSAIAWRRSACSRCGHELPAQRGADRRDPRRYRQLRRRRRADHQTDDDLRPGPRPVYELINMLPLPARRLRPSRQARRGRDFRPQPAPARLEDAR